MTKLMTAAFLIFALIILSSNAFAQEQELHCKFTDRVIEGIDSIVIRHNVVVINQRDEIVLGHSEINCSGFGRQLRFEGNAQGYKLILKTCTSEGELEGIIIDHIKQEIGDIICL